MTSVWTYLLILVAVFVWNIAGDLPRARVWILAGAVSFFASTAYIDLGLPFHPVVTLFFDAAVCLAIYFGGRETWEVRTYQIFQLSVLFSIFKMSKIIDSATLYASLLELCNLSALLLIGGTALLEKARANEGDGILGYRNRSLSRARFSLRKARSSQPFHRVRK